MPPIPDLVKLSKLEAQCAPGSQYTERVRYVSGSTSERRKFRKEETWKKQKRLGWGAFGDVWLQRCIDGENQGELQAVKEIKRLKDNNFYKELEAIALFSHDKYKQCFVGSYGWYDDDDSIFITMEYLANGDLYKYLGSPLPENEGKIIVLQILEGLNYMHQNGFAHRDIKPANILVVHEGPGWWVKIADFGISKRTSDDLTALRTQAGTLAFAAPEVLSYGSSELQYTNAIDIWAVGVLTFLILTGKTLFVDHHPGQRARYINGDFAFPFESLLANNISQNGCGFIKKLMAVDAKYRPGAEESLRTSWLAGSLEHTVFTSSRTIDTSINSSEPSQETLSLYLEAEASATWSTHDQSLSNIPINGLATFAPEADPQPPAFSNNHVLQQPLTALTSDSNTAHTTNMQIESRNWNSQQCSSSNSRSQTTEATQILTDHEDRSYWIAGATIPDSYEGVGAIENALLLPVAEYIPAAYLDTTNLCQEHVLSASCPGVVSLEDAQTKLEAELDKHWIHLKDRNSRRRAQNRINQYKCKWAKYFCLETAEDYHILAHEIRNRRKGLKHQREGRQRNPNEQLNVTRCTV